MRKIIAYILAIGFIISCGDAPEHQPDQAQGSISNHSAINDSIKSILSKANLTSSIYENKLRAQQLKQALQSEVNFNLIFNYAKESLNNGDTDIAIGVMQTLLDQNPKLNEINADSKMIHEFLAIGHLRKGEQINCQDNHTDESCIIPIKGGGIYKTQNHTEIAIKKYNSILKAYPDDMQSKWLLNLAYMTLDQYPSKVPKQHLINISSSSSKEAFENIGTKVGADHYALSGTVLADDFNNDNYIDIFTTSWGTEGNVRLFINNQKNGFMDHTKAFNLDQVKGGLNAKQADYNNDGFMDIFIARGAWIPKSNWGVLPNSLLRNNGDGTFTDVTIEAGLYMTKPTQAVEWSDFNNDGYVDIFIANETTNSSDMDFPCDLYFGSKDGTFTNVAKQYGVDKVGYFKGCSSGDVNNDGWMDLYLSNLGGDNLLLINQVKDREFRGFESSAAPISNPQQSFPCWFFDYDNDGLDDIYVASFDNYAFTDQSGQFAQDQLNLPTETEKSRLYRNTGQGNFMDMTNKQFNSFGYSTMGSNYGDIDNDGFQDFYLGTGAPDYRAAVPNRFFKNNQGKSFKDMTFDYKLGHVQKGHGIAFADFDNDGDQDIYAVMGGAFKGDVFSNALFKNNLENKGAWLKFKLVGEKSNRSAIGAKIKVVGLNHLDQEITIYKTVNSGSSFGGNPLFCHIGLSTMKSINLVSIKWPNGSNEWTDYSSISLNNPYMIRESNAPEKLQINSFSFSEVSQHNHAHH